MRRSKRFGLQGSSRERTFPLLLAVITITTTIIIGSPSSLAAEAGGGCAPVLGRVVSLQGTVEAQRAGTSTWVRITRLDTPVCEGDRLRAGRASRAAVFIQPENLIRLDQHSELSFRHTADETFIEFFQDPAALAADETAGCGAGYVITRFPKRFRIRTPHVNAVVEGTEFLVALRCEATELAVFEGKVRAQGISTPEEQVLTSGQVLTAGLTEPPAIRLLIKPADAVQWALYYPPLSDAGIAIPSADECAQLPAGAIRQVCFAQRAEQFLRLGRVEEAEGEIAKALTEAPANGDALAIRAIISVVKGDKEGALSAGQKAVEASPNSSRAWLALSYAQQAHFKLEDALKSVQRAAEITADSSLAQARLAELYMSLGRTRDAEKAARRAVEANPNEERAYTVLGFVHLAQINVKAAQIDFQNALERDSTAPLPRLGLGLAIIRQGQLVSGREQVEIAVALDPTNSLLRSYVGKAYYEENTKERDQLAATQFELAKQLDPNDPTPWFYHAILEQTLNRPIKALDDLQESIELNNLRAPYRSNLLLDQDRAARLISLAEIHRDAGFEQLALTEASRSLIANPHNYSANLFLAEAYQDIPRAERTGDSQYLQALMRSPVGIIAVSPFRGPLAAFPSSLPRGSTLNIASSLRSAFAEYTPLFEKPGTRIFLDALVGTEDTIADQAIVAGTWDSISMSFGQGLFRTDGFKQDRHFDENSWVAFGQVRPLGDLYIQTEVGANRSKRSVVAFDFDPAGGIPLQIEEDVSSIRVGGRYEYSPETQILLNVSSQKYEEILTVGGLEDPLEGEGSSSEAQYSFSGVHFGVSAGSSYWRGNQTFIAASTTESASFANTYAYVRFSDAERIFTLQGGLASTSERAVGHRFTETSPKIGLALTPYSGTTLRFTAFQATRRQTIANETLEPTQLAGFNQYWDDGVGGISRQKGVGIDQRFGRLAYAGVEYMARDLDIPLFLPTPVYFDWEEYLSRAYAYFAIPRHPSRRVLPTYSFALSFDFFYEDLSRPEVFAPEGVVDLESYIVPIAFRVFPNTPLSIKLATTYVQQKGRLVSPSDSFSVDSNFWTLDFAVDAKLPSRLGRLSIGISNLSDRRSEFTETSPAMSGFSRERASFARLTLTLP